MNYKEQELEQIEKELEDLEILEDIDNNILEGETDFFNSDSLSSYLRSIGKYPLLSLDEEKKLGKDLKLINSCLLSKVNKNNTFVLDIDKLFKAMVNKNNYNEIIILLKKFYNEYYPNSECLKLINKYYKNTKIAGRALNESEILYIFNKDLSNIDIQLDETELLKHVNMFVKYGIAKEKMMKSNLKLVVNIANKYKNIGNCDFLELIGEGNIGLMRAIDKYDVDLGFKFSTFAVWWIRQGIVTFIYNNRGNLSVSRHFLESVSNFNKQLDELKTRTGKNYNANELASIFNLSVETVVEYLNYSDSLVSLDQPVGEDEENTILDFISDSSDSINDRINDLALKTDLLALFEGFSERDIDIIKLRYGIDTYAHSLESIARKYNITRERVRQIEYRLLKKMKKKIVYNQKVSKYKLYQK